MNKVRFEREDVFQWVQKKDWEPLMNLFKDSTVYAEIQADSLLKGLIDTHFVNELISGNTLREDKNYILFLEEFYILHTEKRYAFTLSESDLSKLVEKLVLAYKDTNPESARRYANKFPHLPISQQLIEAYEKTQPKVIAHSQSATIGVTENRDIEAVDATISLFKSNQEYEFYLAVREVYCTYMVYPNVALSSLIDLSKIRHMLNPQECDYFFKGVVDCVVFDQANSFIPLILIEIDSPYHDLPEQKVKDALKDSIAAKAGKKLYRIRKKGGIHEHHELIRLIREAMS